MKIHTMSQRSKEWFAVRLGKITGTSFPTMANGQKATIETLCMKTAAERITGASSEDSYTNSTMEAGFEAEALARQTYETTTLTHVEEVGFLELDEFIGVSPDGLIGDEGLVEIKCPMAHTHLKYLTSKGKAWRAYKWQIQGGLYVGSREWCDFASFCPSFPPASQLYVE